jgi:predicted glycogen debranching enzyme
MPIDDRTEWLESDGRGGFASGTTSGVRTRRYHALLLSATTPPTGRMVLVNGVDVFVDTAEGSFALSSQRYAPGVVHPDGAARITSFRPDPWPAWEYTTGDGTVVRQELFVHRGSAATVLTWDLVRANGPVVLRVRPFLSGRDYHALHHENPAFQFEPAIASPVTFAPYAGTPGIEFVTDGEYRHAPHWYRAFMYSAERERGLDDIEDLAAPGEFQWTLDGAGSRAVCVLRAVDGIRSESLDASGVVTAADALRRDELTRRSAFHDTLERYADAYVVRRNRGRTIIAGYPWFTDWGRDTFIAMRGLCLATGRLREARDILLEWSATVSQGMLPNRYPDRGEAAEFNAVDASLWYAVVVGELLEQATPGTAWLTEADQRALRRAVDAIVSGYAAGTRFGIRMDADGLLAAGTPGVQLTWMDARVDDRVITPRIGKPVEVQALWINALAVAAATSRRWVNARDLARRSFDRRFWDEERGYLADVIDVDHAAGTHDASFRPNQILAVGGLPTPLLDRRRARLVVDAVERRLLTPLGLRSLAPGEPAYTSRYEGDSRARDAAYHQGTVWPWLMGPFVQAWLRARGNSPANRGEARRRFLQPLLAHLDEAGLGHISEVADAEFPFTPRGCPFQAWSIGEMIRLDRDVLAIAAAETIENVS